MGHKIFVVLILLMTAVFSGCLSGKTNTPVTDIVFDVKPTELTVKSGDSAQMMIRVTNNGKSVIHPVVRFNMNTTDKIYVTFNPESYDIGNLRPGEDSGFKIVDVKANIAAGTEIKYQVRAQVVYDGRVLESKDILITVTR